jgi:hypothetical protein
VIATPFLLKGAISAAILSAVAARSIVVFSVS